MKDSDCKVRVEVHLKGYVMLFVEIYVCSIVYRRTCAFLYFLFIKEYLRRDPLKFGSNFCLLFSFDLQFLAETKQFLDPPQSETLIRPRNFFTNQSMYSVQNMNSPSQHRSAHSVMMIKWSEPVRVGSATYNYSASRVTGTDLPLSVCLCVCHSSLSSFGSRIFPQLEFFCHIELPEALWNMALMGQW
jgi:hypothetical protein